MKNTLWRRVSGFVILLALASGIPMHAEKAEGKTASLTVAVAGNNGFTGTATINRFEAHGNQIVAIGFVRSSSGASFAGVVWPVTVTVNGNPVPLAAAFGQTRRSAQLTRIAWSPDQGNGARLVPVQSTSTSCGVLNITVGSTSGTTVNLAGASVTIMPIGLDISGDSSTPVGGLVCSALNVVKSVSGVVNLLNSLLSTLTGLVGGVTGGLGGVTGGVGGAIGGF